MKTHLLILTLILLNLATASEPCHAASPIVQGTKVTAGNRVSKTVVALIGSSAQGQSLCTASLVAQDLAVTAAHCVTEENSAQAIPLTIIFATDIHAATANQIRKVDGVRFPVEWNPAAQGAKNTADVAVLHFSGGLPVPYEASDLLPFDQVLKKGEVVEIAGYGISNATTDQGEGILRHTNITLIEPAYSATEVRLDQSHGGGACHGDSGGPAYLVISGQPYLFGITSRGSGACDIDVIYTRLEPYRAWFEKASASLRKG